MSTPFEAALEQSAKLSINLAARMTGLAPEKVAAMLQQAIPAAIAQAEANPEAALASLQAGFEQLPEPIQAVYERLGAQAVANGATAEDLGKMLATSTEALQNAAAEMAPEATAEQTGAVLGAAAPALRDAFRNQLQAAREAMASAVQNGDVQVATTGPVVVQLSPEEARDMFAKAREASAAVFGRLAQGA